MGLLHLYKGTQKLTGFWRKTMKENRYKKCIIIKVIIIISLLEIQPQNTYKEIQERDITKKKRKCKFEKHINISNY